MVLFYGTKFHEKLAVALHCINQCGTAVLFVLQDFFSCELVFHVLISSVQAEKKCN